MMRKPVPLRLWRITLVARVLPAAGEFRRACTMRAFTLRGACVLASHHALDEGERPWLEPSDHSWEKLPFDGGVREEVVSVDVVTIPAVAS